MEQRAVRLAHHLRQNIETPTVRHADADFLHAEIAAALDDLLERRDQRLGTIEAEALGAGIFDVEEFLEAFRLYQLVEDRALSFAREGDLLVTALDPFLDPAFLRGILDVHELDAERLAVGPAEDADDFEHRGKLEAEHLVQIDLPLQIGFGEAVGARIQFFLVLFRLEPQRIELGVEVAADPVGTDQHQRVNRIACRLQDVGRREFDTFCLRRCRDLLADLLFGFGPLTDERRDQIAIGTHGPVRLLPGGAASAFYNVGLLILQALEKSPP